MEAKWERDPLPQRDLLVFRGKIEGKSAFTRGVLLSLSGVSREARDAITRGKQPNFFVMDEDDLRMVLEAHMPLDEFLVRRQGLLAEEGAVCAAFSDVIHRAGSA